ncbi:MAG TPA: helix-turn-helix transcriptional regulator [Allocoleopsis sp.]
MDKLRNKSLSGYDLTKEIYESTSWKPSFGSMYPLLKELLNQKLVTIKTVDRKKIYSLSRQGEKVLNDAIVAEKNISEVMKKQSEVMQSICSAKDKTHLKNFIEDFKDAPMSFGNISKEVDELHKIMFKLYKTKKLNSKEKEIKAILKDSVSKLRRI